MEKKHRILMSEKAIVYFIMTIIVPVAGEFRFYPLQGIFRVSLGTPIFLFFQLWFKNIRSAPAGCAAGVSVVLFRTLLIELSSHTQYKEAMILCFPALFYYLVYGWLFHVCKVRQNLRFPLLAGLLTTGIEIISSLVEIVIRAALYQDKITLSGLLLICLVAFIRSFFVLGLFYIIIFSKVVKAEEALQTKNEKMLFHFSNLMVETVQLKKSLRNIEQLTKNCYGLYNFSKNVNDLIAKRALEIATEVHEIKKDHQRIYTGLVELMKKDETSDYMSIDDILAIIVSSNNSYQHFLGKKIKFAVTVCGKHPLYNAYFLLSAINHLVTNAVEAIEKSGSITLTAGSQLNLLIIRITDDGPGIAERGRKLIFQPGFTTKFDSAGNASTGIGLTYVKDFIEHLGGTIELDQHTKSAKTSFIVALPIDRINEKGGI